MLVLAPCTQLHPRSWVGHTACGVPCAYYSSVAIAISAAPSLRNRSQLMSVDEDDEAEDAGEAGASRVPPGATTSTKSQGGWGSLVSVRQKQRCGVVEDPVVAHTGCAVGAACTPLHPRPPHVALFQDKFNKKCSSYISSLLEQVLGRGFVKVDVLQAMQMR